MDVPFLDDDVRLGDCTSVPRDRRLAGSQAQYGVAEGVGAVDLRLRFFPPLNGPAEAVRVLPRSQLLRANRRWQPEEEVPEPEDEIEPSAEAAALQSIGRQSMLDLIENLSLEQQQVLTLKFVFNLPNAEVATVLEKTEGAIKSLQHRALVSLQKQISQKQK